MNVFALDDDPYVAAESMCDKHINKMIIESCQILSCVIDTRSGDSSLSKTLELPQYPKAHAKHPCTLWAMETRMNAQWLIKHLHGLEQQFKIRYPRSEHKLAGSFKAYTLQLEKCTFDKVERTPFAQAMPDQYKCAGDPVTAYRTYYLMEKTFAVWKKTDTPAWYKYGRQQMLYAAVGSLHAFDPERLAA